MKKILFLLSVAFFGMFGAFAQAPVIYTKMTAAGYEFKYLKIDSGLLVPFRDTLVYRNADQPGIIVYKPGAGFFGYNGTNWRPLVGVDTTSLSNRINQKLNIVDTANIRFRPVAGSNVTLSGTYPNITINAASQSTDTSSLSNRINQKLNITDTANVRVRLSAGTNITSISGTYPNLTINAGNQSTDTSSLSNRINQKLNISDTANVRVRLSAGTNITSISGTYPNLTINAGNQSTDTSSLSNRINQKLNITDTANVRVRLSAGTNISSISGTYPNLTINASSQSTDTSSLSNRIDQKLNIADTANIAFRPIAGPNIQLSGSYPNITITGTGGGGGGGSSVNYYLNGSINQGTFAGSTYYQLSKTPVFGAGTNFTRLNSSGNGYVASFITDANDPGITAIPGGNWNLEFYFNSSTSGGSPKFYGEIYKWDGSTFTLIASGSINPETITNGTSVDQYFTSIPIPQTTLTTSDRIAVRVYVITDGRNITLHTEDNNLSEVLTSISVPAWKTSGNADVTANQFLGSINNASLRFKTFGEDRMILDSIGRLQVNGLVNNTTYANALQLANKNGRSIFNISTTGATTHLSIKANNNAVGDSLVIADTGLIQSRSNTAIWLKGQTTGTGNVNVNAWRSSSAGAGSIFSANVGTNAPIFNMLSTGQMSIGAETPVSTAALDITSTSRGLLIPRMTTTQRDAISSPASQLLVANTTNKTVDMYNGTTWNTIAGGFSNDLTALQLMGATIKSSPIGVPLLPSTGGTMLSGRTYFNAIYVNKEVTITGATWFQSTQGSYTAANYNGIALYRDSSGTLLLIDSTTRDGDIWKAATTTWNSKAFAGGSRTLQPGVYYLMVLANTNTGTFISSPVLGIGTQPVGMIGSYSLLSNSRKIFGGITGGIIAPPSTQAMSTWNAYQFYFLLFLY